MNRVGRIVGRILALVLVGYLVALFVVNFSEVRRFPWSMNVPMVLLSWGMLVANVFFSAFFLKLLLARLEEPVSYRRIFRGVALSNLFKYLPGGIWAGLSLFVFLERERISRRKILLATGGLYSLSMAGGLVAVVCASAAAGSEGLFRASAGFLLLPPLLIVTVPVLLRSVSQRLGLPPLKIQFSIALMAGSICAWLFVGLAFSLLARGLSPSIGAETPVLIAALLVAWLGGVAVFIVPAGLGVREGILTGLLSLSLPLPVAAGLSLCTRLWAMAADAAAGIVAWRI